MAFKVPAQQIVHIKKLLELPDEKVAEFLDALAKVEPQFNVSDLAAKISSKSGLPGDLVEGFVRVLAGLYLARDREQPLGKFVDEALVAIKAAQVFSPESIDAQSEKLRKFFVTALSLERTLGTSVKAGPVLTAHERIFSDARIVTDVRPIFHLNVSEKPDAVTIVHMLKITQRDDHGRYNDEYFALDSRDILAMNKLFKRAIEKEETLKRIMKDSGMTVLDPKPTY